MLRREDIGHFRVSTFPYRDGTFGYVVSDLTRRAELAPAYPLTLATSEAGSKTEAAAIANGKRWLRRNITKSDAT